MSLEFHAQIPRLWCAPRIKPLGIHLGTSRTAPLSGGFRTAIPATKRPAVKPVGVSAENAVAADVVSVTKVLQSCYTSEKRTQAKAT